MTDKALALTAVRKLAYEPIERLPPEPDQVVIETLFSGISAGTELSQYRGTSPFMNREWDERPARVPRRRIRAGPIPVRNLGYEEVGRDRRDRRRGDAGSSPATACSAPGAIAQSYDERGRRRGTADARRRRSAHRHLLPYRRRRAERRPRRAHPDGRSGRRLRARRAGADRAAGGARLGRDGHRRRSGRKPPGARRSSSAPTARSIPTAAPVHEVIKAETGGRGADICIEVSGAPAALAEAMRTVAYASRVVAMGFFQGEARGLHLGDEFHHNRIELISSQISGRRAGGEPPLEQAAALADRGAAAARRPAEPAAADHRTRCRSTRRRRCSRGSTPAIRRSCSRS